MKKKSLRRKIIYLKIILNVLLNYLSPTNILVIYFSQKLDKLIFTYQNRLYKKYTTKHNRIIKISKVA